MMSALACSSTFASEREESREYSVLELVHYTESEEPVTAILYGVRVYYTLQATYRISSLYAQCNHVSSFILPIRNCRLLHFVESWSGTNASVLTTVSGPLILPPFLRSSVVH